MPHRIVLSLALTLAACGSGATSGDTLKPEDAERGDAPQGILPTADARPVRDDDLSIRVRGRSPVPPVARGDSYRVDIEIRNRSIAPISLGATWIQLSVLRDALLVEGCAHAPRPIAQEPVIAGGSRFATAVALPCALEEPGVYSIVVVLLTPADGQEARRAPERARVSGHMRVVIEGPEEPAPPEPVSE